MKFNPCDVVQIGPERFIVVGTPYLESESPEGTWWPVSPFVDGPSSADRSISVRWYAEPTMRRVRTAMAVHAPSRLRPNGVLPGLGFYAAPAYRVRVSARR